jgi:hypothetical protein
VGALNLFNYDYEISANKEIFSLISIGVSTVTKKSIVYQRLANHFSKVGNEDLKLRYMKLANVQRKREL